MRPAHDRRDNRCRVLLATTGLGVGGAERVVLDIARHLDAEHIACEIATFTEETQSLEVYGPPGVPCRVFNLKGSISAWPSTFSAYRHLVRDFKPHVIHAHMYHALLLSLAAVSVSTRKPKIIYTSHSSYISPLRARVVKAVRAYRDADILFSADQHANLNTSRTVLIPNGVAIERTAPSRSPRSSAEGIQFIYVGRLSPEKDPLGMVRAFAEANIGNARLDIVGQGPLEHELRALIFSLSLDRRVRLLGLRTNVRDHLREADVFLMHSHQEGLPMALLEAGAEAMPVISTGVGSIPQLLGDARGFVVDRCDFASTMRLVAQNMDDAIERGRRLFSHVSEYHSVRAMVSAHQRLYLELSADGKASTITTSCAD